jgi:hypothetical protein
MLEWQKIGEKYKNQRRSERKTILELARQIGCLPSDLCKAEAGMIDPREIYKENAK